MAQPARTPDEDWESDDEFEQSVLELDQSISSSSACNNTVSVKPSSSTSEVIVTRKIRQLQPTNCSTPLPATRFKLEERNHNASENNNKQKSTRTSEHALDKRTERHPHFAEPSPVTASTKRKRKFPGPAGTLPKLVSCLQYFYFILFFL